MFDYIQKFNNLPKSIRDKVSNPEAMKAVKELEQKYDVDLASIIMKVMVKDISVNNLDKVLMLDKNLSFDKAQELANDLKEAVFAPVGDYLGMYTDLEIDSEKPPLNLPHSGENSKSPLRQGGDLGEDFDRPIPNPPLSKGSEQAGQAKGNLANEESIKYQKAGITPEEELKNIKWAEKQDESDILYTPEDEKEIKKISEEMKQNLQIPASSASLDDEANSVVGRCSIIFPSEELNIRLKNIIKTYLMGIRNKAKTRETLTKSVLSGGVGISSPEVDKIFALCAKFAPLEDEKAAAVAEGAPSRPKLNIEVRSTIVKPARLKREQIGDMPYDYSRLPKRRIEVPEDGLRTEERKNRRTEEQRDRETEKQRNEETENKKDIRQQALDNRKEEINQLKDNSKQTPKLETATLEMRNGSQPEADPAFLNISTVAGNLEIENKKDIRQQTLENKKEEINQFKDNKQISKLEIETQKQKNEETEKQKNIETIEPDVQDLSALKKSPQKSASAPEGGKFGNLAQRIRGGLEGKVKIEDIKYAPKITGPLEELRIMNVVFFRRLDNNPQNACQKIIDKIGLLEKENFSKRMQGIQSWRQSPLFKLYLQIGTESMANGGSIEAVDEARRKAGKDYLTFDEFSAIMDLNKKLRY